jgi:orotate phosphoribosyltransferase
VKHEAVASALLEAGGLKLNEEEPFILASRKIGPVYLDVRQLTATPSGWTSAVEALAQVVRTIGSCDLIAGGELADLFFSIPVALRLGKPHLAIRKAPKTYGAGGGRLVGRIERGQTVVHVSDLITSGTSALDWVEVLRGAGGVVEGYVVVFDRGQGGREALVQKGVVLHSLLTLDEEFLSYASEKNNLSRSQLDSIERYLKDPEGWARDFLRRRPSFLTERVAAEGGKLTRSEGLEVLTKGYPDLIPELGDMVRKRLREIGASDALQDAV